jgi:hypothetical protein
MQSYFGWHWDYCRHSAQLPQAGCDRSGHLDNAGAKKSALEEDHDFRAFFSRWASYAAQEGRLVDAE